MGKTFQLATVLITAVFGGAVFGYFTANAGPAGFLIGAFYAILIAPLVVILLAKEREILVWQAGIVSFVITDAISRSHKIESILTYITMAMLPWFLGTLASGMQVLIYVGRSKSRASS